AAAGLIDLLDEDRARPLRSDGERAHTLLLPRPARSPQALSADGTALCLAPSVRVGGLGPRAIGDRSARHTRLGGAARAEEGDRSVRAVDVESVRTAARQIAGRRAEQRVLHRLESHAQQMRDCRAGAPIRY